MPVFCGGLWVYKDAIVEALRIRKIILEQERDLMGQAKAVLEQEKALWKKEKIVLNQEKAILERYNKQLAGVNEALGIPPVKPPADAASVRSLYVVKPGEDEADNDTEGA